ncbi:DMT family transporter [Schwartzia succinivorans]|uniref:EamA domain-containing membrane protein RarD n=1 Tax=Schwartzia succinivorans DSM 10502 TaxID=1123243 RepID=A0A1M4TLD6_9FIRM|nr:DMT family transporter [Schwartzia succinivorans]SHE45206.1 EamA domain-containing membrane protein RarD [Schwartzia succinivorans DSM 10502]
MRNLIIGSILLSLAGSIWGAMFIAVRFTVGVITPTALVWLRYGVALVPIILIMLYQKSSWKIEPKDRKLLLLSALTGHTLSIVTQESGTMLTSAQMGSVVTAATPAFMVAFGCLILHERFNFSRLLSVVLATAGVLLIVVDPENLQTGSLMGGIYLIVAAVTWAFMSVLIKLLHRYSAFTITFYSVLIAFLALTPYGLWWLISEADFAAMAAPHIWGSVLYVGVISTTAGFVLWSKGLTYMDASIGGLFMFFQPIVGTLLGYLLLDEAITSYFVPGFLLIAIGVILAMKGGNTTAAEKLARSKT